MSLERFVDLARANAKVYLLKYMLFQPSKDIVNTTNIAMQQAPIRDHRHIGISLQIIYSLQAHFFSCSYFIIAYPCSSQHCANGHHCAMSNVALGNMIIVLLSLVISISL